MVSTGGLVEGLLGSVIVSGAMRFVGRAVGLRPVYPRACGGTQIAQLPSPLSVRLRLLSLPEPQLSGSPPAAGSDRRGNCRSSPVWSEGEYLRRRRFGSRAAEAMRLWRLGVGEVLLGVGDGLDRSAPGRVRSRTAVVVDALRVFDRDRGLRVVDVVGMAHRLEEALVPAAGGAVAMLRLGRDPVVEGLDQRRVLEMRRLLLDDGRGRIVVVRDGGRLR